MNEKGVSVNLLLLTATVLPPATDPRPAVNGLQFAQYLLDTSATTSQAISNAQSTRVSGPFGAEEHYFVCDATGSCATLDYLNGQLVIAQSPFPMALSNSPYYPSYQNLQTLLANSTPGQVLALPGPDSLTRFAKAAILSTQYTPQSEEVSYALNALNNVAESDTQWKLAFSLANQSVQYRTATAPGLKYIDLQQFNPSCSSGVQWHYLNAATSGDITSQFSAYSAAANNVLVQTNNYGAVTSSTLAAYPTTTQCMETSTNLVADINPSTLAQTTNLAAQVIGNGPLAPTGTVTFWNGTTTIGAAPLGPNRTAHLATNSLASGSNSLTAVYSGDFYNTTSTSAPLWEGVNVQPTQTTLFSSLNSANVNQSITLTATVAGQGSRVPTGSVTFLDGTNPLATVSLSSQGTALWSSSTLVAGTHSVTAAYSGDSQNAPSTSAILAQAINIQPTQISLTSSINPSDVAQVATFPAIISGAYGATPTGTVGFSFNGTVVPPIVRLQGGQGSILRALSSAGSRRVVAVYSGDRDSLPSASATLTQSVQAQPAVINLAASANPSAVAETVTYTATVSGQYGGSPTGSVTFNVNGSQAATVSLSNGQAIYITSFPSPGTESVTADYAGDTNNLASTSSPLNQIVDTQQVTQTSLSSSMNPAVVGQSLTYSASVTAQNGGVPTGSVTFNYAGNPVATVPLSNGQASYPRTLTTAGKRSVTALYSGDANNLTSASAVLNEVINQQPTQTTIASSANPAQVNQSVTVTATVLGQYGAPCTGSVTFSVNGSPVPAVSLTNGQASYVITSPSAGTSTITASYSGDWNNLASASPMLTESVNLLATQTTITTSTNPSLANQPVTFIAMVAGQPGSAPTGNVAFTINGNKPITVPLSGGQAAFTWTFLYPGTRLVTASYSGDNSNQTSSTTASQTINP